MEKNERERHSFTFSSVHESGSYFWWFLVHDCEWLWLIFFGLVQFILSSFLVHKSKENRVLFFSQTHSNFISLKNIFWKITSKLVVTTEFWQLTKKFKNAFHFTQKNNDYLWLACERELIVSDRGSYFSP